MVRHSVSNHNWIRGGSSRLVGSIGKAWVDCVKKLSFVLYVNIVKLWLWTYEIIGFSVQMSINIIVFIVHTSTATFVLIIS